jgi:purine-binding chemotaxis protein CheW
MELAKIRIKSRQEAARGQGGTLLSEPLQSCTESEAPPALSLPDDLPDDLFDLPTGLVSFPGPASVRPFVPAPRFDPLTRILAGRDHDRIVTDDADDLPGKQAYAESSEVVYEEFLCFRLGDEEYGINIMEIKEIIKPRELTEVPRTPDFVDGVLSLRGVIVPVFAMRKRLGMQPDYDRSQERIIIVRCGEGLHGLRVDRVTDVVKIAAGTREATPSVLEGVAREFVSGIGRTGNRMVILLDICKVVDATLGEVC